METFGSGPYSPLGEFPSEQFLAMTADLPIIVTFEPVEIPFATTRKQTALRRVLASRYAGRRDRRSGTSCVEPSAWRDILAVR